ncbi:APC family permease [Glutamicibacter protophormiae]|uniref:APC family permease n=1 Tax=unclassified Kocuria TaxID=2649579 RepID=UPI000F87475C|nr:MULTISPECIES: APC family permease [unclassified Kocuria]RUP84320.1 APC family permease [Kocuria sp. HSID17590]RUQ10167.1 APC family permease [Kocuria sp. HSID17582]WNB87997.1 APC family permease [Glutamicibacter protophormiae]
MTPEHAPAGNEPGFKKVLGRLDAIALGVGAMIGFGWVVLTGGWLDDAGTLGAVLAMLAGGAIMAVVGLVYGELVAAMPAAGGEHNYLLRGMGARWAFIGSWGITVGYITIVAFEAVAVPRTVEYIFPDLSHVPLWTIAGFEVNLTWALVGALSAVVITWINLRGVKQASTVQIFVIIFLGIVGLLMVFGAVTRGSEQNMEPFFHNGVSGFFLVLVVVPFLFVGFDVIPQVSEEMHLPPRKLGGTIVTSVLIATVWYAMVILTTSSAMSAEDLAGADIAVADAFGSLFHSEVMANVLLAGGLAGILTSWNSLLMGASRLLWALGNSRMLPHWFAKLHPRYGTPSNALLFVGALSFIAPFFGTEMLGWLVDSGSPSIVVAYLLVSVVFVLLRRREPQMERPYRIGGRGHGGTAIGVLSVVLCLGLAVLYLPGMPAGLGVAPYVIFCLWWVLGLLFMLRIPRGITPGEDAEHRLVQAVESRRRER